MGCAKSCQIKQSDPPNKISGPHIREVNTVDRLDNQIIANFMSQIRPLDLIVFRGADIVSKLIRELEDITTGNGQISHVEIAINREWCNNINPLPEFDVMNNTLLSWGSTMSGTLNDGVCNIETGTGSFGVQFRKLEDLIRHYLAKPNANVGLCRLLDNPTCQRPDEQHEVYTMRAIKLKENINNAYTKYDGQIYNANPLALLGAMFPAIRGARDSADAIIDNFIGVNKWLFCSELIAVVYIEVGIINDKTDGVEDGVLLDARDILPVDFLGADADKNGIKNAICETVPILVKSI